MDLGRKDRMRKGKKETFKEAFMGRMEDEIMANSVHEEDGFVSEDVQIDEDGMGRGSLWG